MTARTASATALILLLAGCTTVGPDYKTPQTAATAAAAANWIEAVTPGRVERQWWQAMGDLVLAALVEQAIASAPDVREAEARVLEARAQRDAVLGGQQPQAQVTGSASENMLSKNGQLPAGRIPGLERDFPLFDVGFDASWEIDFWGRKVRQAESAAARTGQAEAAADEVRLALAAETARAYIDLRQAEAVQGLAARVAGEQGNLARLTQLRYTAGEATRIEAERAASEAAAAGAQLADAAARARAARYRLAPLVGQPPETVAAQVAAAAPIPDGPDAILTGIRSDLLRRRPDIRRAERELAAATAEIGVATADLFPRFSLFGGFGQQARSPEDLLSFDSTRFSLGPRFSWPVFQMGTIRAQIRAADARAAAAAARYDKAVIGALADSETAINRFLQARIALHRAEQSLAREDEALALVQLRVRRGEDDRLALARAELVQAQAVQRRDAARAARGQAAVALYKALGGGWER